MKYLVFLIVLLLQISCNCRSKTEAEISINLVIDDWHLAVTEHDSLRYFGHMTETSRFLGTDESERWTKSEFIAFSMPYFHKKKTWNFKPLDRKLFISKDVKYAWFDEVLDTWMGPCRGSGVMRFVDDNWKIEQYNLAVLIPNTKINDYLEVMGKPRNENIDGGN